MASSETIYKKAPQRLNRRGQYFKCETCGDEFYVYPSYIKKAEKRGASIRFCSMKCYDKTGDNNPFFGHTHKEDSIRKMAAHPKRSRFKPGKENPNFVRFGEEYGFQGSRVLWWKRRILRDISKCERCDFADIRVLVIHHKDRDRGNNDRSNMELLCPNCHAIEHWEARDGIYSFLKTGKYHNVVLED